MLQNVGHMQFVIELYVRQWYHHFISWIIRLPSLMDFRIMKSSVFRTISHRFIFLLFLIKSYYSTLPILISDNKFFYDLSCWRIQLVILFNHAPYFTFQRWFNDVQYTYDVAYTSNRI